MAVKGLKEALAKKRALQNPEAVSTADADIKITPTRPIKVGGHRPMKKAAGRGR